MNKFLADSFGPAMGVQAITKLRDLAEASQRLRTARWESKIADAEWLLALLAACEDDAERLDIVMRYTTPTRLARSHQWQEYQSVREMSQD